MMLHDPGWLFKYFLPLLQYVKNFASNLLSLFMYIQKSIQLLWLHCCVTCMCGLKRWCLTIFFNVVCINRSVLLPHAHISAHRARSGNKKLIFILFFFLNNWICWDGHMITKIIQLCCLSYLTTPRAQQETKAKKKMIKRKQHTQTDKPDNGPFWKDSFFFCFANIMSTLKK